MLVRLGNVNGATGCGSCSVLRGGLGEEKQDVGSGKRSLENGDRMLESSENKGVMDMNGSLMINKECWGKGEGKCDMICKVKRCYGEREKEYHMEK